MSKHRVLQCLLAASMLSTGGLGISPIHVLAEEGVEDESQLCLDFEYTTGTQTINDNRINVPVTVKIFNKSGKDLKMFRLQLME